MKAEILSIGTELLLGHIVNTNAAYLSQKLAEIGIDVYYQTTVGDNPDRLRDAIRLALVRSDMVIMSGGLGPTVDDVTIEVVAKLIKKKLIPHKGVLQDLKNYFAIRRLKVPRETMRQIYVPQGVKIVRNKVGTAPGLISEYLDKIIVCLPGPPRELEPMFANQIIPYIEKRGKGQGARVRRQESGGKGRIISRTIKTTGLAESQVNDKVKDLLNLKPPTTVGIYAKLRQVELRIMAKAANEKSARLSIAQVEAKIRSRLGDFVFGCDNETLESVVGKSLIKSKKTIAIAESCTGGLLGHRLTNVSGSSNYFIMGVTTYANETKISMLGVPQTLLQKHGAVSKPVALAMANGIRSLAKTDIGIGITGIAGPSGATKTKPVGLVYIAFSSNKRKIVQEMRSRGTREEIKFQASQVALDILRKNI